MASKIAPRRSGELLIEGHLYDVTEFKNHPGGSIIKFYTESGDATDAFNQFHMRSTKARKMLAAMPSRPAPPEVVESADHAYKMSRHQEMTKDLLQLMRELQREGWFDWSPLHTAYRVAELLVLLVGGLLLIQRGISLAGGLVMLGIFQGRCGWLMHEAGHLSMTSNIKLDILLQELIYGFGDGMSGGWWRSQHNRHHATPQKLGHDVDLETLPLIAFNSKIAIRMKNSPLGRLWLRAQAFLFFPVTCLLVALSWQFVLHPLFIVRQKKVREAIFIALRYVALYHFCANVMQWTLLQSVAAYAASTGVGAIYIFGNFALSHTHLPTVAKDDHVHWLEYASIHTININPFFGLVDWWMGYLNYQIEHHVFPSMPQYRFVKLSPRMRQLFEKHGLKYDVRSYWSTMWTTVSNLHSVGNSI